jgi:hypothetical protein
LRKFEENKNALKIRAFGDIWILRANKKGQPNGQPKKANE